jgi:hypothetical protein
MQLEEVSEQHSRGSCLPCPVRPANQNDLFHEL